MIDESSEEGVSEDGRVLGSTGVLGGDVEGGVERDVGDIEGDVDDMDDSDDSREHSEQSKIKTQPSIPQILGNQHDAPGPQTDLPSDWLTAFAVWGPNTMRETRSRDSAKRRRGGIRRPY